MFLGSDTDSAEDIFFRLFHLKLPFSACKVDLMASLSPVLDRRFRGAERGGEDIWDYKMCKKIAQLTKVIYTLNCRTEDNEARTKWIEESHQREIARITSEWERKISETLEKVKRIETSKAASIRALEENHKRMLEDARKGLSERAAKLESELERHRNSLNESLETAQKNCQMDLESEIARIRTLKDKEIENLVKEYNEKYNSMLLEQLNAKDSLESELNRSWGEKVAEVNRKLKSAEDSLSNKLRNSADALEAQKGENSTLMLRNASLEEEVQRLENLKGKLSAENEDLIEKLEIERNASCSAHSSEADLRKKLIDAQAELQSATCDLRLAQDSNAELEKKYEKAQADSVAFQNAMSIAETAKNAAEHETKSLKVEMDTLRKKCSSLEEKLSSLSNRADCSEADVENLRRELHVAHLEMSKVREDLSTERQNHDRAVKAFQQQWEERLCAERQKCINEGNAGHQDELKQLKQQYEAQQQLEKNKILDDQKEIIKKLQEDHKDAVHKLEKHLQNAKNQGASLGNEFQSVKNALTTMEKQLNEKIEAYEDLLKSTTARHQSDEEKIAKLENVIALLRSNGQESEDEHHKEILKVKGIAEEEIQNLRGQHANELKKNNQVFHEKMELLSKQHCQALQDLKKEHAEELKAMESNATCALSEKEKNMMNIQDALRQKMQEEGRKHAEKEQLLNAKLDELKKELDKARMTGAENSKRNQENFFRLQKELEQSNHEIEDLKKLYEKERREILERESLSRKTEIENLTSSHRDAQRALELQIDQLKEQNFTNCARYDKELQQIKEGHEKELEEKKREYRRCIEEELAKLQNKHIDEMSQLQVRLETAGDAIKAELSRSQQCLSKEKDEHARTDELRQEALGEIFRLRSMMEKEKVASEEMLRETHQKQKQAINDLLDAHRSEISRLTLEHNSYVSRLMAEWQLNEGKHKTCAQELREALSELQYKYDYRESRSEDLEMINRLVKENKETKKELEKAYSDMKYFKLELINREENYNKLFGRRPVVAASSVSTETGGGHRGSHEMNPRTKASLSLPDIGRHHGGFGPR